MSYEIVTRLEDGAWTNDEVGSPNTFDRLDDAWEAVEELRRLGDDFAEAEYDVRERGN